MSGKLEVVKLEVGELLSNCYILHELDSGLLAVIDPGGEGERIVEELQRRAGEVAYIINTHGHIDHIGANNELKEAFPEAILCVGRLDERFLIDESLNLSAYFGLPFKSVEADKLLDEGDTLELGREKIRVIHTPGHTPGGISLLCDDMIFCGDTLFAGSVGRCDLPGGDYKTLLSSIKEKLLTLPEHVKVYPGHGPATNIGYEKATNPFLSGDEVPY